MAQSAKDYLPGGKLGWAGLLVGGIAAGLAMPKLLMFGRRAVRGIGGMTYRTAGAGSGRASADPAGGRPA